MMRRIGTVVLACALAFSGEALARSAPWHGPVYSCYWQGSIYRPGGYCVSNRGIVEVCLTSGDWMSVGHCLGDECRVACPG